MGTRDDGWGWVADPQLWWGVRAQPASWAVQMQERLPSASASTQQSYTLAQVQQHNTASDCWAAINGGVYNLTDWISQHPGGPERITPLCGTDASAAFNGQHSGQSKPESTLTQFYIGELAS